MVKSGKIIVKAVTSILTFILMLVIVIVLYNFIQLKVLNKPYASFLGYSVFEVASGSMEPTISEKDLIIVKMDKNISKDDIITYQKNGTFITHRVMDIKGNYIIARGDANNSNDAPVSESMILGKVIKIIPQFGIWRAVILTPKVFISIVTTIILFSLAFSCNGKPIRKCIDFAINKKAIIEEYNGDVHET